MTALVRKPRLFIGSSVERLGVAYCLREMEMRAFDFGFEDFMITGYDPHPSIKAEIAV